MTSHILELLLAAILEKGRGGDKPEHYRLLRAKPTKVHREKMYCEETCYQLCTRGGGFLVGNHMNVKHI